MKQLEPAVLEKFKELPTTGYIHHLSPDFKQQAR
jgi:hypothetical protein